MDQDENHGDIRDEDRTQLFSNGESIRFPMEDPPDVRALNITIGKRRGEYNARSLFLEAQDVLRIYKRYGAIHDDYISLMKIDAVRQLFIHLDKLYKMHKIPLGEVFARALYDYILLPRAVKNKNVVIKASSPVRAAVLIKDETVKHDGDKHNDLNHAENGVVSWDKIQLERNIAGIKVLFPFPTMSKPQIQIMSKLIHGVKNAEHVVLESPTGTGKTAAILSGLLSWLYQAQIQSQSPNPEYAGGSTAAYEPSTPSSKGGESITPKDELATEKPTVNETSTPKRDAAEQSDSSSTSRTRVVYLTRTHVQIRQVMDAIKRSGFTPRSCSIASRLQLCIYKPDKGNHNGGEEDSEIDMDGMKQQDRVNAMCQILVNNADRVRPDAGRGYDTCSGLKPMTNSKQKNQVCPYYVNMGCKNYAIATALRVLSKDNATWDIEDLVNFGSQPINEEASLGCRCDERDKPKVEKKHRNMDITKYFAQESEQDEKQWKQGVCPYYTAKAIAQIADFVVCPYPYIVGPHMVVKGSTIANMVATALLTGNKYEDLRHEIMDVINEKTNISGTQHNGLFGNMKNTVLVFDEGHNLENSCIEEASWDIELGKLKAIIKWLLTIRAKVRSMGDSILHHFGEGKSAAKLVLQLNGALSRVIVFLQELVGNFERFIQSIPEAETTYLNKDLNERVLYSWDRYEQSDDPLGGSHGFLQAFDLEIVKVYIVYCSVLQIISHAKVIGLIGIKFIEEYRLQLEYMLAIMVLLCHRPECYNVLILTTNDKKYSLGLWLMNPSAMFSELSMNVRSIVIASGTLSPIPAMVASLGNEFEARLKNNIISATQTLSKDQFALYTLTNFEDRHDEGDVIECNYKRLKQNNFLIQLGNAIASLLEVLPGGTLVFFPNRNAITKCIEIWKATPYQRSDGAIEKATILERMMQCKDMNLYQEPSEAAQFAQMIKELQERKLFVMLAVYRSHASEGLNLKLSSLILVGLPFPSIVAPKIDMARRYHRANSEKYNWYLRETYRAVNQSIGRCIRTKHDKGVVILMDRRYTRDRDCLSPWVHPYSRTHRSVDSVKHSIRTTFTF